MKYYMREHSNDIRIKGTASNEIVEDEIATELPESSRVLVIVVCRSRQRLLQQAWSIWCQAFGVKHDYSYDVRMVLTR